MARDYVKNASNVMNFGAGTMMNLLSGVASVSFHAWINMDTTSSASNSNNKVISFYIQAGSNCIHLNVDNVTNA